MAKRNQTLGLDIGHATIKATVASGDATRRVERTELLRLPAGEFDRRTLLQRWLKEHGLIGLRTVVSLTGQQAMFQPLFLVPGDPRTIEQATAMEMVKLREIGAEGMTHGYAPFGGSAGSERRVLLTMVRPEALENTLDLVRDAGLDIADVVPAPVALFNALARQACKDATPVVFVHMGHSLTELAIGSAEGLMFARAFAGGGQLFTEVLARARQIPVPHAETAKISGGITLSSGEPAVTAALTRAADMWIAEFQSCLAVFNSLFAQRRDRPQTVVLTGGGSLMGGFATYLQQKTGLTVSTNVPLGDEAHFNPAALWPIAAALALLPPDERICPISVLPQRLRDEQVFRRQKPYWLGAAAAAALILGVNVGAYFYDNRRMERQLQVQNASLERRKELVSQIEGIRQHTETIRDLGTPVVNLLRTGPTMRRMLSLVADAKDPKDWITLICDAPTYYAKTPSAALYGAADETAARRHNPTSSVVLDSPTNRAPIIRQVIVEGYTRKLNFSSVQSLIDKINDSPLVESADLLSDDRLVPPETPEDRSRDPRSKRFAISVKVAAR